MIVIEKKKMIVGGMLLAILMLSLVVVGMFWLPDTVFAATPPDGCDDLGDGFYGCTEEDGCYRVYEEIIICADVRTGVTPACAIKAADHLTYELISESCPSDPAPEEVKTCSVWMPDVGDAAEKGLIATDEHGGALLIGTLNEDGTYTVVATITTHYSGDDWFQVPDQYRTATYWFKIDGCGRWHGASELGLIE